MRNNFFRLPAVLVLAFLAAFPFPDAKAQNIPSTAEPGVIMRGLQEERREPSRFEGTITVEEDQIDGADVSAEELFTLQGVVVDGSTIYSQDRVNALVGDYLGQPASFADLNAIARLLTRTYRADGYVFSRVIVPPQTIKDGIVHLQAIEGRVTDVQVIGEYKDNNNLILDLAEKIKSEGPANTKDLERYLLLIDDLPGIRARSLMKPSEQPGGGELVITIEQDGFEGAASIDNRGSEYLGQTRGTLVAAFNSLLGIHDRTTLRGIMTRQTHELRFADITHEEQIGSDGLRIKGRFAVTDTEPGKELDPLDVKGISRLLDFEALYPLIRGRQFNLNLIGGLTLLNSESEILGLNVAEDRVRFVRAGGTVDFTDSLAGVNQFDLQVAQGLDIFHATEDALIGRSRGNGEHEFLRFNLSATRIQDLPGDFSAQLMLAGQHSADPLLASEEFAVGGPEFGRAYDSGEITGDRGVAGAIEIRYGGVTAQDFLQSYQLYGFYDAGRVWNTRPAVGESGNDSLASAGVGVRFNLDHDISGYVELDTPLTRDVSAEGDDDSRIFFNILKRL